MSDLTHIYIDSLLIEIDEINKILALIIKKKKIIKSYKRGIEKERALNSSSLINGVSRGTLKKENRKDI